MPAINITDLNQAKENTDFLNRYATTTALTTTDRLGRERTTAEGYGRQMEVKVDSVVDQGDSAIAEINEKVADVEGVVVAAVEASVAASAEDRAATEEAQRQYNLRNYPGTYDVDPVSRPSEFGGGAIQIGDSAQVLFSGNYVQKIFNGTAWYVPNQDGQALAAPTGTTLVGTKLPFSSFSRTLASKLADAINPLDFGAVGDGTPQLLSERYESLAEAQEEYPFVTSLDDSLDWAAFQLLANEADEGKRFRIRADQGSFYFTQPVLYGENWNLDCAMYSVQFLMGWTGGFRKMFAPKRPDINFPTFLNVCGKDLNAILETDGRPGVKYDSDTQTYAILIDFTDTYRAHMINPRAHDMHAVVYAGNNRPLVHQGTRVPKIMGVEGFNTNYGTWMPGTETNHFPYGDVEIHASCSKGNTRYGDIVLDTDGCMYASNTRFPNGTLVINGNELNISASQQFDPRIPDTETSTYSPMNLFIPPRRGGARSEHVKLIGVSAAFAGQGPAGYRKAPNIRIAGVRGLTMVVECHQAIEENLILDDVEEFNVQIVAINANDQGTANKAAPGTYHSIRVINGSKNGWIGGTILSGFSNRAVYIADGCKNVNGRVVTEGGTPGGVRVPADGSCNFEEFRNQGASTAFTSTGLANNRTDYLSLVAGAQTIDIKRINGGFFTLGGASGAEISDLLNGFTGCEVTLLQVGNSVLRSQANGGVIRPKTGTGNLVGPRVARYVRHFDGLWWEL